MIALSVVYLPFIIVVVGLLRITALRFFGILQLKQVNEMSIDDFFVSLGKNAKAYSVRSIVRLLFYNPRGGIVLLMILTPIAFLLCVVLAIVDKIVGVVANGM
jgi:hypothetical protein